MSLKEAVLEIADQMEADAAEFDGRNVMQVVIKGFIRQLRSVAKVAPDDNQTGMQWIPAQSKYMVQQMEKQAKDDLESATSRLRAEDKVGTGGVIIGTLTGGPFDGDTVPINPEMPLGAKTAVGPAVYKLVEDNRLEYDEDATAAYQKQLNVPSNP